MAAPRTNAVLAVILISYFMLVLDVSIVIAALPQIRADLGFTATGLSWVQSAYLLAFGGLLLLGARAGDLLGRRRMFVVGLGLFTAASLVIGLAVSPAMLIAARAVQGVGAAVLAPSTLALLQTTFREGPDRTRALGYYGAVAGVGASVGLVAGGVLTDLISWRVGFFINVPLGIVLLIAATRVLPETVRHRGRLDLPGAVTSTLGLSALVYGLVRSADAGWTDPLTLAALVAGVALVAGFLLHERRAAQPILPLRVFASRQRSGAYAARFLFLGAMVGFWFFTAQFLQGVLGYSPTMAGLAFLPTTVVNFAAAMAVPRLIRRFGNTVLMVTGLVISTLGAAWLTQLTSATPYLTGIALPMVLIGLGQGLALTPLTTAGVAGVPARDAGAASGAVNVAHQLGGSLGLAVLVTVAAAAGQGVTDAPALLADQVAATFDAGALMLAVAVVIAVATRTRRRPAWQDRELEDLLAAEPAARAVHA